MLGFDALAVGQASVTGDASVTSKIVVTMEPITTCLEIRKLWPQFTLNAVPAVQKSEKSALHKKSKKITTGTVNEENMVTTQLEYVNAVMYIDMFYSGRKLCQLQKAYSKYNRTQ